MNCDTSSPLAAGFESDKEEYKTFHTPQNHSCYFSPIQRDTPTLSKFSILALAEVKNNDIILLQDLCQLSPESISHQHLLKAKVIQVVNGKTHALQMHQEKSAMPGIMI